ncbi:hypothetical protein [Parabacteroides sp. PF5-9]|uniref:hypothetical protein n=1 Tax=Parabacteroides sp. PF5-9 TaxID=1742404 RepID=UPI0024771292|nr:hypothetical protein [Parabacteroides sp. PF5-9]MDH6357905.1 hypothetical protein [Parabacteroides sp. PF5-9]
MHILRKISGIILLILPLCLSAKERRTSDLMLTAGLNNASGYELELSTTYLFNNYFGATLGLGGYCQFEQSRHLGGTIPNGDEWRIYSNDVYAQRLLLRPALRLRMPVITVCEDWHLSLNSEPGLYLVGFPNEELGVDYYSKKDDIKLFPYHTETVKNKGGKFFFWNVKNFIELHAENLLISAGYTISNFDIYNGRRNIKIEGFPINQWFRKRMMSHSVFVSIGYCF